MSMTEIYQPVIILYLLEQDGSAGKTELARVLSGYDKSIQTYYEKILMRWPKITLTKHEIVEYDKKDKCFSLRFRLDNPLKVAQIKDLCEQKIRDWLERRNQKDNGDSVDASKRFRVLKASRGKCELCGISAKLTPIDIDHIVPRTRADKRGQIAKDGVLMNIDDERNLQALCFRCNRAKRDQDATDFRLPAQKLVRDRIPDLISADGRKPVVRYLRGKSYRDALIEKLTEEHAEFLDGHAVDEVVDMIEVLLSLAAFYGYDEQKVVRLLREKRAFKGGFAKAVFLEAVSGEIPGKVYN